MNKLSGISVTGVASALALVLLVATQISASNWRNSYISVCSELAQRDGKIEQKSKRCTPAEDSYDPAGWSLNNFLNLMIIFGGVVIAAKQVGIYRLQTALLDKRVLISDQAYLATHRPRLRVRNIVHNGFNRNFKVTGNLSIANIGHADAKTVATQFRFLWNVNSLPMDVPWHDPDGASLLPDRQIIPGGTHIFANFSSGIPLFFDMPGPGLLETSHIYAIGRIYYTDKMEDQYCTAFCR